MNDVEGRMPFLQHLEELRFRLIRSVLAICVGFGICVVFSQRLFSMLAAPITRLLPAGTALVFTSLPDPFFIYLKIAFFAGLFLALPYVLYQLWQFVYPGLHEHERKLALPFIVCATLLFCTAYQLWQFVYPGLHEHERKLALPFIVCATLLFYSGGAFAYFLVFPAAFKFFLGYVSPELKPMLAIRE